VIFSWQPSVAADSYENAEAGRVASDAQASAAESARRRIPVRCDALAPVAQRKTPSAINEIMTSE